MTGCHRVHTMAKPLIAPALAVRVLREVQSGGITGVAGAHLTVGLAAATVGDIYLLLPDDDARMVRGAASFAVMQTAYARLLYRYGARPTLSAVGPRLGAGVAAAALLAARARPIAPVLSAYGLTLGTMSTLAAAPLMSRHLAVGRVAFLASDGLVTLRRCILRGARTRALSEGAILTTYALAQVLLVEGMIAAPRRSPGRLG
ncbi:MAG: lysoplasmalogenase family protein [Mycobacteriaceae bacterium]